jgi:carbamoyl-phosphate synthase large subunit
MAETRWRILVAGIGGASLGTEILKCLRAASGYAVFGCDISGLAFGHYQEGVEKTFVIPRDRYVESVLEICRTCGIRAVIPGGEEPLVLLGRAAEALSRQGIVLAANSASLVTACSDKTLLFDRLRQIGVPTPWTRTVSDLHTLESHDDFPRPCVIKPATGTGGSMYVSLADTRDAAVLAVQQILAGGRAALIQEYVAQDEGEFTVGVLSLPDCRLVGSVAMRRVFHSKLSVRSRTEAGLISSGYSQGLIDDFSDVRNQAERIAVGLESAGPLNIQARVRHGILLPFEVNPRFSATTYLRALAGFNEVDVFLRCVLAQDMVTQGPIRPGYYLRSLAEVYVPQEAVKS